MEWDVEASDRREVDAFDLLRPTDVLAISSAFDVIACARLLTRVRTDYAGEKSFRNCWRPAGSKPMPDGREFTLLRRHIAPGGQG
ncbi:MAG: hypothetical protein E5X58_15820, partial [Mesorhizobium sp.]